MKYVIVHLPTEKVPLQFRRLYTLSAALGELNCHADGGEFDVMVWEDSTAHLLRERTAFGSA